MASNRVFNFGPVVLMTTLTTNILNCNITSLAGPVGFTANQQFILIRHFHILNKTGAAATFSLWKGATGANTAGTELLETAKSVPANSSVDYYGVWRFDAADFLVGGSNTATALTMEGEGEIGVSG